MRISDEYKRLRIFAMTVTVVLRTGVVFFTVRYAYPARQLFGGSY